ncbi:MAG: XdhC family protein [Peptococcaceae bacterium]|nr:XdhC family protein [Peptococcaceae bacterium]
MNTAGELYQQLMQAIKDGNQAAVISTYNESGIQKILVSSDSGQWAAYAAGTDALNSPIEIHVEKDKTLLIERYASKSRLIIFGGGHIALPLTVFGSALGFFVTVFDDRPGFANAQRFPSAQEVVCDQFEKATELLRIRPSDYTVIVTRGHRHDQLCLRSILKDEPPFYIGMIGSKRRVAIVRSQLLEEGFPKERLDQIHAPVGLNIGAVTPEEIAISILAEIIRCKRLRSSDSPDGNSQTVLSPDMEAVEWLAKNGNQDAAMVTVVSTDGSTPREAGAKMLVLPWGEIIGSIGGGCAESDVIGDARDIIKSGGYRLKHVDMADTAEDDGMVCGGVMEVLIESVRSKSAQA